MRLHVPPSHSPDVVGDFPEGKAEFRQLSKGPLAAWQFGTKTPRVTGRPPLHGSSPGFITPLDITSLQEWRQCGMYFYLYDYSTMIPDWAVVFFFQLSIPFGVHFFADRYREWYCVLTNLLQVSDFRYVKLSCRLFPCVCGVQGRNARPHPLC